MITVFGVISALAAFRFLMEIVTFVRSPERGDRTVVIIALAYAALNTAQNAYEAFYERA